MNGVARETCRRCWRASPVGFYVPDAIWLAAVPDAFRTAVLCIMCFDEFATERGVVWDHVVELFPVSGAGHARSEFLCR